jgi:hypothetical protein
MDLTLLHAATPYALMGLAYMAVGMTFAFVASVFDGDLDSRDMSLITMLWPAAIPLGAIFLVFKAALRWE